MAPRAQSTSGCWGGRNEHPWVQGQAGLPQLSVLALPHLSIYFWHHRSSAVPSLSNWASLQQSAWVAASSMDGSHPARKNRDRLVFLLAVAIRDWQELEQTASRPCVIPNTHWLRVKVNQNSLTINKLKNHLQEEWLCSQLKSLLAGMEQGTMGRNYFENWHRKWLF